VSRALGLRAEIRMVDTRTIITEEFTVGASINNSAVIDFGNTVEVGTENRLISIAFAWDSAVHSLTNAGTIRAENGSLFRATRSGGAISWVSLAGAIVALVRSCLGAGDWGTALSSFAASTVKASDCAEITLSIGSTLNNWFFACTVITFDWSLQRTNDLSGTGTDIFNTSTVSTSKRMIVGTEFAHHWVSRAVFGLVCASIIPASNFFVVTWRHSGAKILSNSARTIRTEEALVIMANLFFDVVKAVLLLNLTCIVGTLDRFLLGANDQSGTLQGGSSTLSVGASIRGVRRAGY
jgi:hypothetical protein